MGEKGQRGGRGGGQLEENSGLNGGRGERGGQSRQPAKPCLYASGLLSLAKTGRGGRFFRLPLRKRGRSGLGQLAQDVHTRAAECLKIDQQLCDLRNEPATLVQPI